MNNELNGELKKIASRVSGRLEELFSSLSSNSNGNHFKTSLDSAPELLGQVAQLTLRGGKRLRAALVIHGGALFDVEALEGRNHLDMAAAMELIQSYLLIHDDIIDDDDVRRNGPTVHVALGQNGRQREEAVGLAILAGDLANALAERVISDLEVSADIHQRVRRILSRMHLDVIHGQTLDVTGGADAETIARHKTASYTTLGPLLVGAALSGANESQLGRLADCALPLGVAFQLRDDMLGIFGDESKTGKPKATDLRGGKRNWVIEKSLELADEDTRVAIDAALGDMDASNGVIETACRAIEKSGARQMAEDRIDCLVSESIKGIYELSDNEASTQFMVGLAEYIGTREL